MSKAKRSVFVVLNEKGLHTRPAAALVRCAAHFDCQINLSYRNYVVNGKSILGILMLAAGKGAKVTVEATGQDAEAAIAAILRLASSQFNVKY